MGLRWAIVLGLWLLYAVAVYANRERSENVLGPATAIPVAATGLLLGWRAGLAAALLSPPMVVGIHMAHGTGESLAQDVGDGAFGWFIGILVGAGSGFIAERAQRESEQAERLRASEALVDETQAVGHVGSWEIDLVGGRLSGSPETSRLYGIPHAASHTFDEATAHVHPDDRPKLKEAIAATLRDGVHEALVRVVLPDGVVRWLRARGELRRDAAGQPARIVGTSLDVTAEHAAEEEIRAFTDAAREGIVFVADGKAVACNPAFAAIFGMRPDDIIGGDATALLAPQDVHVSTEALAHPPDQETIYRVRRLDGTPLTLRVRFRLSAYAGRPVQAFLVDDVTGQQAAEARYRMLSENATDMVQQFDDHGICTYASPSSRSLLGYAPEEMVGRDGLDLLHPDDLANYKGNGLGAERPDGTHILEARARRKDGTWVWVETVSRALVEDGRLTGFVSATRDISQRRQAEQRLRDSEARFRDIAESIQEVFWMTDPAKSEMIYVSPAYEAIWGRSVASLMARPRDWLDAVHPDDRERVLQAAMRQAEGAYDEEYRIRRPDGQERWIHDRAFPVREGGAVARIVGVAADVTARHEAEARRAEVDRLRELAAFKTQFLNNAAHELATPLTPIKLEMASLRRQAFGDVTPQQKEALDLLDRNLDRLRVLVQDLLDAARLQGGRLKVVLRPLALAPLASDVVLSFKERAREAGVQLAAVGLSDLAQARGDDVRLSQVLTNLVHNALKFTPRGGRVEVALLRQGAEAVLAVRDTGMGLDADQVSRLFQPFAQVHDTVQHNVGGTGLGLYISKGIVEQHGGRLLVHSDGKGRGCTFEVHLPLAEAPTVARPSPGPSPVPA